MPDIGSSKPALPIQKFGSGGIVRLSGYCGKFCCAAHSPQQLANDCLPDFSVSVGRQYLYPFQNQFAKFSVVIRNTCPNTDIFCSADS